MTTQLKTLVSLLEGKTSIGRNQFRELYKANVTDPQLLEVCKHLSQVKTNWGTAELILSLYTESVEILGVTPADRKIMEGTTEAILSKPVHNTFEFCMTYVPSTDLKVKILETRSIGSKKLHLLMLDHWLEQGNK